MAVHWTIPFRSLRTNILYTVNIYDSTYSGNPIPLKGGAEPFSTQEADDEDGFIPIRTQSGYLRIVDDGYAADGTTAFNWKQLLPMTDTDRPVTLTNGDGDIVWQGFMQAQNFSGTLYGNPQEREFPVQCVLTVLEGTDINYQQTEIKNFAYLLNYIISSIPTISITTIKVQGNTDAQSWLLKCIDWQNFVSEDNDGNPSARFNLYQCLEDMCRFWGWTARTFGTTLYLTCADDSDEQQWLTLTRAQLETMAGGIAAGTTGGSFITLALSGDIFASMSQNDFRQRGPNKATVNSNAGTLDNKIIYFCDKPVSDLMNDMGWQERFVYNEHYIQFTNNMLTFDIGTIKGQCRNTYGSFNILRVINGFNSITETNQIRLLKSFSSENADAYVSLESCYSHLFNTDGYFAFHGKINRYGESFTDADKNGIGKKTMYMRFGIGESRNSAKWYTGTGWSSSLSAFKATIGNSGNIFYVLYNGVLHRQAIKLESPMVGKIYIDFLGSSDMPNMDGMNQKYFEIVDFDIFFERREWTNAMQDYLERENKRKYTSSNGNNVRDEYNIDCIYASDNDMKLGPGVLMNPNNTYMGAISYNGSLALEYPEQHLANRVTSYWSTSKRKLVVELISNGTNVNSVNPGTKVTLDDSTLYPISFSREWRDDITLLSLLQL